MPRLPASQIKDAITHEEPLVREAAVRYFTDACSDDPEVLPRAIEAIEMYGREAFEHLFMLKSLAHTDQTLTWCRDELVAHWEREKHKQYVNEMNLGHAFRLTATIAREAVGQRLGLLAADTRTLKREIDAALLRLLDLVSAIALAALAVASLGVLNTILASVRARRWQLGVLRCAGLTRAALVLLIVAEAILIAIIAVVLGIGAGLLITNLGLQMGAHYAGYSSPLIVAPGPLLVGVVITLAVTLLASAAPALLVARAEPLRLLQSGRAS